MEQLKPQKSNEHTASIIPATVRFVPPPQMTKPTVHVDLDDVRGIVSRVIETARSSGRDYVDQCRLAAQAVVQVRPDLGVQDVLKAIFRMRELNETATDTKTAA